MTSQKARYASLLTCALLLFAAKGDSQNDNQLPPPHEFMSELSGQSELSQILIIVQKVQAIDQHLYVVDGVTQKQYPRIRKNEEDIDDIKKDVKQLQDENNARQTNQDSNWIVNVVSILASGGSITYVVRQKKKKMERDDED